MSKQRRLFTTEFKREAASLVLDQGYSHTDACRSLDVGETALQRWVDQLRAERKGITPSEVAVLFNHYMIWWQYYAEKVIRYSSELAPADLVQANRMMRGIFSSPVESLWFETLKPGLNPDAVRYVESLLAQPG